MKMAMWSLVRPLFSRACAVCMRRTGASQPVPGRGRLRRLALTSLLGALLLTALRGAPGVAHAAAGDGVDGAITYAVTHWDWTIYDDSLPTVDAGTLQPRFQCAEFVARSLASAGPIGSLTPGGAEAAYGNVTYNGANYNLELVSGLYHFLLDTSAGTDAGTSLSAATLGSVLIYGNAQDGDFLHTAIVTDTTNAANPLFSAHNVAYLHYPASGAMYDEYGHAMAITHILQVNYGLIAGGALQTSVGGGSGASVQMNAPAPYQGNVITSGISLSWQAVTGADTYGVSLYDVNGRLIDGLSTASTSFSYDLSTAAYGVYDYIIQPESTSASFLAFFDTFNYEPSACLVSGSRASAAGHVRMHSATQATISPQSTTSNSCGTGSGEGTASAAPSLSPATITVTTPPGTQPAYRVVTLTNASTATYDWQLGEEPSWVTVLPNSGSIAAGSTEQVTVYFWGNGAIPSSTPGTYATTLRFFDTSGIHSPLSLVVTVVEASPSQQWYFAEGYTGGSFTEYLTLANPGTTAAVNVQYLLSSGSPITATYQVNGGTRVTVNVNAAVGPGQNVAMVVTANHPIIAERPMYFTYTGLPGYTIPGGSDILGATQLRTQYDFGYLDTSPGHATYLTILNPTSSSMSATVQYFSAAGGTPTILQHTVAGNSRGTVNVSKEGLAPGSYSALVTLSAPGLVERPMYLVDSMTGYTGATDVVGVTQPLTAWYFAEGYTSNTFSERYILSNPSTTTSANATVTFYRPDGSTATAPVSIAPGGQQVVNANTTLGSGVNNSAQVTADQPILAERFMSFQYRGPVGMSSSSQIPGATDVLGTQSPGYAFYFAEGYTGRGFAEYLSVENPDPSLVATVTVMFLPQSGGAATTRIYTVAPSSRFTLNTSSVMGMQSFSMIVQSNLPIVAERPMYFTYTGTQTGGTDVIGYQLSAPPATPAPWWNLQASANPGTQGSDYLNAVAAVSSTDIWAVGGYVPDATSGWAPLIEHWDGTLWSPVPSPSVSGAQLSGVTAVSSDNVWAVGATGPAGVIVHWDGISWDTIVAPIPSSSDSTWESLSAVSAVSASDVWAVGNYVDQTTHINYALTEHWDGNSWAIMNNPASSATASLGLNGITVIASNDVWAVGWNGGAALIEHWDGTGWSIVSNPSPAPGTSQSLSGVAAVAANDVWAVGELGTGGTVSALLEHWDGTGWSLVSTPVPPNCISWNLSAVAAVSATDIWTLGSDSCPGALIEHWDGTNWTVAQSSQDMETALTGVAIVSAHDIWAVGGYGRSSGTFTEHYGS